MKRNGAKKKEEEAAAKRGEEDEDEKERESPEWRRLGRSREAPCGAESRSPTFFTLRSFDGVPLFGHTFVRLAP